MGNMIHPGNQTTDRGRIVIILALFAAIILLLAILFMLFSISRDGLSIRLGGDVNFGELGDRISIQLTMDEPIALSLPQPLQMVASGPDGAPIPATLAFSSCPSCGGSMLPSHWSIWDGHIEWTCPTCDALETSKSLP